MDEATTLEPAKVLARNTACHQCRRRKLKCDGLKPICTNCTKPRVRGVAATAPPEPCTWDEVRDTSSSKRRRTEEDGESSVRLRELEAKLASFEKAFSSHPLAQAAGKSDTYPNGIPQPATGLKTFRQTPAEQPATEMDKQKYAFPTPPTDSFVPDGVKGVGRGSKEKEEPIWVNEMGMSWPDYEVLDHIAHVFFDKVPTLPKLMHKASFFSNLSLPPSHRNFPAAPLLHAILAITANHISEDALASPTYFPTGTPHGTWLHPERDFEMAHTSPRNLASFTHGIGRSTVSGPSTPLARFQLWHRRKAYDACPEYFDQNRQVLQVVQAQCIICSLDALNAWWVDVWMEAGACVRAAVPLQIHETPKRAAGSLRPFSQMLLQDSASPLEQAERDRTWWMVYITERNINMTTVWASAIPDQEVTVELPVTQSNFDHVSGELTGTQSLHDLYTAHPPLHANSLTLLIKAFKLWADVNMWFRFYTRGEHTLAKFINDPSLRMLLSQINAFRLSCPLHLRRPTQAHADSFDVDLIAAHMIAYGATITLGEPLIEKESWTSDVARVSLSAIRACLSMLYDITATSFDVTRLPCACSYVWTASIRVLCRFMAAATETGDSVSVGVFMSEIEVFRLALSLYGEKFPVAVRHGKMIDELFLAKVATGQIAKNLDLACSAEEVFDVRFKHGTITRAEGAGGGSSSGTPASTNALPTPGTSSVGVVPGRNSLSGNSSGAETEFSPTGNGNGMLATLQGQAMPLLEPVDNIGNSNGNFNGAWSWKDTTKTDADLDLGPGPDLVFAKMGAAPPDTAWLRPSPPVPPAAPTAGAGLAAPPVPGPPSASTQTAAPSAMWNLSDFADPAAVGVVDAGFDVSSISFDFDAMADFFANSGTTFNGEDFVFPNQY